MGSDKSRNMKSKKVDRSFECIIEYLTVSDLQTAV